MIDRIVSGYEPRMELKKGDGSHQKDFREEIDSHIIGQSEAKEAVTSALFKSINAIVPKRGPIGVFLFAGPSGVGKTEMGHTIAETLLWHPDRIRKINCESLAQSHMVSNLMGSPKGYVGYSDPTLLENLGVSYTEAVKDNSISNLIKRFVGFNVILFDEIEKSHPSVHQALLGIFDHGMATMGDGTKVDFSNSIIIMTTNIGECDIREAESKPTMGFITPDRSGDREKIFTDSLKKFSPEFIGRIDKIVHFNSLTVDDCVEIIKGKVSKLNQVLNAMSEVNKTTRVSLHLVPTVYKYLANKGYNKAVGARDLTRVFDQEINSDFSEVLQNNQMIFDLPNYEAKVVAELIKGKIAFIFSKKNVKEIVKESKRTYTNIFGL